MWHLYLDESGDLGFDFTKQSSEHLTICILATSQYETVQKIHTAVKRTLKHINRRKGSTSELKGAKTDIKTKRRSDENGSTILWRTRYWSEYRLNWRQAAWNSSSIGPKASGRLPISTTMY
jgi:hypothetical protein